MSSPYNEVMPIYAYACEACSKTFETLVTGSEKPSCPSCGSLKLEKQLSVFAVAGRSSDLPAGGFGGPCGSCGDPRGPGSCQNS